MVSMKKFRWWAFWRRLQYGAIFVIFLALIGWGGWELFTPTVYDCFDGIQNGEEEGIDCNGNCVRICASTVIPPTVLWAESFSIREGQYNAVGYVENRNDIAGSEALAFTFEFYAGERLIDTYEGETVLPPNSIYPIFVGRIETPEEITSTRLRLQDNIVWQPASAGRTQFRTASISLLRADSQPRLEVTLENTAVTKAEDIEVVATLFSANGDPLTASQTFIEAVEGREQADLVFTWPNSIATTIRSCMIPTDVALAIDLSGSMNDDGGMPPQPISDVVSAASTFVNELSSQDQVSVITFASEAATRAQLSSAQSETAALVSNLSIPAQNESGFTNTAAAIIAAQTELASTRHNEDARRVLILLTDGQPTSPEGDEIAREDAVRAAASLRESGATVYAIGLGDNVNRTFIEAIAGDGETAFLAPDRTAVAGIYQAITSSLCESGATRIEVIAKTKTNFVPLTSN